MPAHKKHPDDRRRGAGSSSIDISKREMVAIKAKADARGLSVPDHVVDMNERIIVVTTEGE